MKSLLKNSGKVTLLGIYHFYLQYFKISQLKKLKEIWKQKSIKHSLISHYFLIVKILTWVPKDHVLFRISIWKLIFCSQKKFLSWFGFKIFCGGSLHGLNLFFSVKLINTYRPVFSMSPMATGILFLWPFIEPSKARTLDKNLWFQ